MYDFCQNEGEVTESEDETSSYESEEDQEQVGCRYFFIKVLFEPGLCNNYQEKEVVRRKGRCPLLIRHLHQLNMFN